MTTTQVHTAFIYLCSWSTMCTCTTYINVYLKQKECFNCVPYYAALYVLHCTCEGLYDATRCSGVSWFSLLAKMVLAPFLMRKEAENESPLKMARWRRLLPEGSRTSRSQPWPTRVLAIPSLRSSRARLRGMFPSLSQSFSFCGSCQWDWQNNVCEANTLTCSVLQKHNCESKHTGIHSKVAM